VSQAAHGGYCTVFDCEPGECPDEAVCVLFGESPSSVLACQNESGTNPSQRSFCMKKCEDLADCRHKDGYTCMVPASPAENLDNGQGKVCMLPQSGTPVPADRPGDVCVGMNPSGGAGGAGGTGGVGDGGDGGGGQGGESGAG